MNKKNYMSIRVGEQFDELGRFEFVLDMLAAIPHKNGQMLQDVMVHHYQSTTVVTETGNPTNKSEQLFYVYLGKGILSMHLPLIWDAVAVARRSIEREEGVKVTGIHVKPLDGHPGKSYTLTLHHLKGPLDVEQHLLVDGDHAVYSFVKDGVEVPGVLKTHRFALSDVGKWFVNSDVISILLKAYPPGRETIFFPNHDKSLMSTMSHIVFHGAEVTNIPSEDLLDISWTPNDVYFTYPDRMAVVRIEEAWDTLYVNKELYEAVLKGNKGVWDEEDGAFIPDSSLSLKDVTRMWLDIYNH